MRPYGSLDAEAAYKNAELAREAAGSRVNRASRALQLETELRIDSGRRADRFAGGSRAQPGGAQSSTGSKGAA